MNINKVLKLGVLFAVMTLILSVSGFAQTYVSATNGDDSFGTGSQAQPYKSITKAISVLAGTGGTISVQAGIYNAALTNETVPVTVTAGKTFTFVGTAVDLNTTVSIPDGFVLNGANAVVNMGLSGTAGFNLGSALTLSAGSMNIVTGTATSGVTLASGATLTVTDGTLNAKPATGANLTVVFNGANAVSSTSAFLPNSLGSGSLTISKATGAITIDNATLSAGSLTINNVADVNISSALTTSGAINISAVANVSVSGAVVSGGNITVSAAATVNFSNNVTLGSASNGAAADLINSSTGTTTIGSSAANTLTLFATVAAGTVGTDANVGEVRNTSTGKIVVNAAVTDNIKNTGTSTNTGDQTALTITLPVIVNSGNTPAAITLNGDVTFANTNVVGVAATDNDESHTVTVSNAGTGSVTFNGAIATPASALAFTNVTAINVKLSNTGGGTFATRAAALRGTAGTTGITNNTAAGTMTLGQTGDAFTASWDIANAVAGSKLTLNGTGALGGALTNGAAALVELGASQTIAGIVTNAGNIKLNANTLTLSYSDITGVNAALTGAGDVYSAATATTGSGTVKFTGAYVISNFSGNLPNVEIASSKLFTLRGNTVYGNLLKTGAAAVNDSLASDIKGSFTMSGSGLVTINDGGAVASIVRGDVNMNAGNITLGTAGLTVEGTVNIPQGTFTFGANTLTLKGDFNRTGGTIDAAAAGTGSLVFFGAKPQKFTPGTQMNVGSVVVNSQGQFIPGFVEDQNIVTVMGSLVVKADFTITAGRVDLGLNNIRMVQTGGTTARFTNNGRGYTSNGVGGLIFEGSGANAAGAGDGAVITGSKPFSNIYVRLGVAANNVYALGAVVISGVVTLDQGGIIWNAANDAGDLFTGSSLTLDQSLTGTSVYPTVVINTANTHGSPFLVDGADGGAVALAITTLYNLHYTGNTNAAMAATDFVTAKVNNLSIINGGSGKVITGLAAPSTIAGNLSVDALDELALGAQTLTLAGNTATHVVNGTVSGGTVLVTGTGATLTGGVGTTNASSVTDLQLAPATGGTFTSTGMKVLSPLTVNQADLVSSITMNAATATVNTFTNTAGTTTLNMNSTAVSASGNYAVAGGTATVTMNDAAAGTATIGGTLTVTGGSFALGSSLWVTGAVTHTGTSIIALGAKNLTIANNYTHNNTASFTATTGKLVAAPAGAQTFTLTTAATVPNFELKNPGSVTLATNGLTVSNAYTQTSGTLDLNSLPLTISGNTFTYVAGTYANTGAAATGVINLTGTALVIDGTGSPTIPYLTVNTTGTVTLDADNTTNPATPRAITVSQNLIQTKGTIALGANSINFTGGTGFTFTAGTITAGAGELVFNGAAGFTPGALTSLTIPNLTITATTTAAGTDSFHVAKKLTFGAGGNFVLGADGRMIIDDGATIVRTANTGTLTQKVQFAGVVDVTYLNAALAAAIVTGNELPTAATTLRNLTVNLAGAANTVQLAANATVNGTLALTNGVLDITTASKALNLAAGTTVNVKAGSINAPVTPAGAYALTYSGGSVGTSVNEWPATATISALNLSLTAGSTLQLNRDYTVGTLTLNNADNAASIDLNGKTLTVSGLATLTKGTVKTIVGGGTLVAQGDVSAAGASFGNTMQMAFTGATNQTITTPAGGATVGNITINKTAGSNTVKIAGGDLTCLGIVTFTNGLILTDTTNALVLTNTPTSVNVGFVRNVAAGGASHVVGNVKQNVKFSPTIAFARNEFPVGDSVNYRPAALTFHTPSLLAGGNYGINVTVRHTNTKPTGKAGLPIVNGIANGIDIAGYPSFFWTIKADGSFGATPFNLDLAAAGFKPSEISLTDVGANQVKMIRRGGAAGDVENIWNLQGNRDSYDNLVVNGVPTVIAVNAVGGLSTGGAIFTYGLKSTLVVLNAIPAQALTAGAATFVRDLNTPAVFGGNSGAIVYTASSSNTNIATVAVSGSTLTVTPVGPGTATITVTGTDDNGQINTSFQVTVNPGAVTVSGKVVYDNATANGIGGATVTLTPATGSTLTATADTAGNYTFVDVQSGSYTLSATKTGTWGGANATDALQAVRAYAGLVTLDALAAQAADVNNSASVNATDALLIVQRFAGVVNTFAKGDWTFESKPITVGSTNVTGQTVKGLSVGDVNKSNVPTGTSFAKTIASNVDVNSASQMDVAAKATFSVPVSAVNAMTVGAVSMKLNYPADMVTFTGVSSGKLSGVVATANDGVITIGWANMDAKSAGAQLKAEEVLMVLNFTAKVDKGSVTLTAGAGSEIADGAGNVISLAKFGSKSVEIGAVPSVFELSQNYPNPFNPSTEIRYSIAAAGHVTLAIYNIMGQEVSRLVSGQQEAGYYKIQFNASGLASGMYIYRLQVDGQFTASKRLTLLK